MSTKTESREEAPSLTRIRLRNFTAFSDFSLDLSPGVNVFVGKNGVGKTHLMKVCYAACEVARTGDDFADKLIRLFLPDRGILGRLARRPQSRSHSLAEVSRGDRRLQTRFSTIARRADSTRTNGSSAWRGEPMAAVFIPAKEVLSNAPGFRSLYASREVHFEETYRDLLDRAFLPTLRGPLDPLRKRLLDRLREAMGGTVTSRNEQFYLRNRQGDQEFPLLAEGLRKIGLLWLLIQNGTLRKGSVLFWDEPETNLNPTLFGEVIETILKLQRLGAQVFLATHDYIVLKELVLRQKSGDTIAFHSLFHSEENGEVRCNTASAYSQIHPNAIAAAFDDLYDRTIFRSIGTPAE